MNPLIQFKTTTLSFLIVSALMCFGLSPIAVAVNPAPDGGYPGGNTAEGDFALQNLSTGTFNTALGAFALLSNNTGLQNTATGAGALFTNFGGGNNTANGAGALFNNKFGNANTAIGFSALFSNTSIRVLGSILPRSGDSNTAVGVGALSSNTIGSGNIAVGVNAGQNLIAGGNNIDIGNDGADESNTIRIGTEPAPIADVGGTPSPTPTPATYIAHISGKDATGGDPVFITSDGKLGTVNPPSSARFKEEIKPMNQASEVILALKPVTFRYKKEFDAARIPQFGLVAEDVEKINPDLVKRDREGKVQTVRYDAVNAMLLNEFLKEHRTVRKQQKEIDALKAELKEQRALIQKVNDKVELNKPAPQTVLNQQ